MSTKLISPLDLGLRTCAPCGAGARAGPLRTGTRNITPGSAAPNTAEMLQHNKRPVWKELFIFTLNHGSNCSAFICWYKEQPLILFSLKIQKNDTTFFFYVNELKRQIQSMRFVHLAVLFLCLCWSWFTACPITGYSITFHACFFLADEFPKTIQSTFC